MATFVPVWEANGGQLLQVLHQSNGAGSRDAVRAFKDGRKKLSSERKMWCRKDNFLSCFVEEILGLI